MRGRIGDKARVQHIFDAICEIENYVVGCDIESFSSNSMMRFACIKQLEIIGEAANHITDDIQLKYSSIEWKQIIGLRNIFVHEYFGIDTNIVWDIISNDLPSLKLKIACLLNDLV